MLPIRWVARDGCRRNGCRWGRGCDWAAVSRRSQLHLGVLKDTLAQRINRGRQLHLLFQGREVDLEMLPSKHRIGFLGDVLALCGAEASGFLVIHITVVGDAQTPTLLSQADAKVIFLAVAAGEGLVVEISGILQGRSAKQCAEPVE